MYLCKKFLTYFYRIKMIETKLQQTIADILDSCYGISVAAEDIKIEATRKDFDGDLTLVVFPYVKLARKAPEALANEIGAAVTQRLHEISSYSVIKGFLNFTIGDDYWQQFVAENKD